MITFGYKKNFESILRALIAAGLGIALFIFKEDALDVVIRIIGIAILFAGVISILPTLSAKKAQDSKGNKMGNIIGYTTCGIAAAVGLMVVLKPSWFTTLFIFLVAAAIIVFCLIQLIALFSVTDLIGYATLPMILCAVALIGAIVVMFFQPGHTICLVTGILLFIYGIAEILALTRIKKAETIFIINNSPETKAETVSGKGLIVTDSKDIDFEEVK